MSRNHTHISAKFSLLAIPFNLCYTLLTMKNFSTGSRFYTELMCMETMAMSMMQMCNLHACFSMLSVITDRVALTGGKAALVGTHRVPEA
ncbi:MAG: hypothetical protein R3A44_13545 [Caldilineaceae bacterium]